MRQLIHGLVLTLCLLGTASAAIDAYEFKDEADGFLYVTVALPPSKKAVPYIQGLLSSGNPPPTSANGANANGAPARNNAECASNWPGLAGFPRVAAVGHSQSGALHRARRGWLA